MGRSLHVTPIVVQADSALGKDTRQGIGTIPPSLAHKCNKVGHAIEIDLGVASLVVVELHRGDWLYAQRPCMGDQGPGKEHSGVKSAFGKTG